MLPKWKTSADDRLGRMPSRRRNMLFGLVYLALLGLLLLGIYEGFARSIRRH